MTNERAALPNSLAEWIPFILSGLGIIIAFVIGLAIIQHQVDDQFIASNELKSSLAQLQSYSEEAKLLAQQTLGTSATKPYASAYASSLGEATDSIAQKLSEHAHARNIDHQVAQTITLAGRLSEALDDLSRQPKDQLSPDIVKHLDTVSQRAEQLGNRL